jgi:hypothetical protein
MKASGKIVLVAVPLAIVTFLLGRVIWPDLSDMAMPTVTQLPFFIFLSALESLSFGLGVAFAMFGWPYLRSVAGQGRTLRRMAFFAITWLLVSWWPHDNMHRVNGMGDFAGLLRIEYLFHFTLMIAGFVLAVFFWKLITESRTAA